MIFSLIQGFFAKTITITIIIIIIIMTTIVLIHEKYWGIVFTSDWWFYYVRDISPMTQDFILRKSEDEGGITLVLKLWWQVCWHHTCDDIDAFEMTFESNRTPIDPLGIQISFP